MLVHLLRRESCVPGYVLLGCCEHGCEHGPLGIVYIRLVNMQIVFDVDYAQLTRLHFFVLFVLPAAGSGSLSSSAYPAFMRSFATSSGTSMTLPMLAENPIPAKLAFAFILMMQPSGGPPQPAG